jgi:DnaK suppressor protein
MSTAEHFLALIDDRIAREEAQIEGLASGIEKMRVARSLTTADDEHDPEGSTVSLDQARDAALLVRARSALSELQAARDRLCGGTYGRCERCGREIPAARLEVRPEARLCVPCSEGPARS